MSRGVNKAIIIGNLGADPEIRYTASGDAVASLRIATSESWKDKHTGELKEHTEWHRITLWRRLAEVAGEYLRKGSRVYIEGQIHTRKWQDQSGQDRYSTEIDGREMQMLDGRRDDQGQRPGGYQQQGQQHGARPGPNGGQQGGDGYQHNRGNDGHRSQGGNGYRQQGSFQAPPADQRPDFADDVPF